MGKIGDWFKKIWNMEVDAYKNLQLAIKHDKDWPITNENTGKTYHHTQLKTWFQTSLIQIIIFFAGIFLIWGFFKSDAKPKKKYSHHGINKYGERY